MLCMLVDSVPLRLLELAFLVMSAQSAARCVHASEPCSECASPCMCAYSHLQPGHLRVALVLALQLLQGHF